MSFPIAYIQEFLVSTCRVGIDIPSIEVRYEHLNIDAEAFSASRALPTFVNFHKNLFEVSKDKKHNIHTYLVQEKKSTFLYHIYVILQGFLNTLHILPSRKKPSTILKDVSGIIKPCRMTLLLGPPSSGKTTLLLALAGKLDPTLKVRASFFLVSICLIGRDHLNVFLEL